MRSRKLLYILIGVLIPVLFFITLANADDYKCLATLYPKLAKEHGIVALGYVAILPSGYLYRLIGECKKPGEKMWLQFLDTTNPDSSDTGKLDNICDFVIQLTIGPEGKLWMTNVFSDCNDILESLFKHCEENNIDFSTFIHKAEPLENGGTI